MSAKATSKPAATAKAASPAGKARKKAGARKATGESVVEKVGKTPDEHPKERVKLVRDSFTMPREDFDLIDRIKARAIEFKRPAKKSELLRAGLQVLAALQDTQLRAALDSLRPLKSGRPKNKR
jgi:hypothetical protein